MRFVGPHPFAHEPAIDANSLGDIDALPATKYHIDSDTPHFSLYRYREFAKVTVV
jgi:hypothetical protein